MKVLDPEFKELEDEEKGMETAIGSEDSEMKENDDSIQKQENDTAEKGQKEVKKSTNEATIVGKYKNKVGRSGRLSNKALSRFTNTADDPICLETDESVKRCKENILDKLTGETDFSNINWCAYIIDSMRGCKKRWKRNDRGVPFSGPLGILTLMYVDSVECKGIKMDKKMNPISFWNMSRLKERQKWEIENGGFGKGKYKWLTKLIEDEEDSGYSVVGEIEGLEKLLDVLHKQKKLIDNKLGRLLEKHPEQEEVLVIKAKYDSLMQTTEGNAEVQAEAADRMTNDKIESVLEDLANCSGTNSQSGDDEKTDTEQNSEPVGGYDNSASENKEDEEETGDKDVNADIVNGEEKGRPRGRSQSPRYRGRNCGKTTGEGDKQDVEKTIGEGAKQPSKLKKGVWKKMVDGKESSVSDDESKLGKEDDGKGKGKVGTDDESEIVYRNNYNMEIEKFRFKTLKEDTKVFNKVIDAWGDVLNFEEKYKSPTSPYRLFCDTNLIFDWMLKDKETDWPKRMERFILNMNRAVCWNTSLIDLRAIDMVFLPMLENDHYYLTVFELKHLGISVIDNFSDAYPLVHLSDHEDYFEKDSAYKVKEIFVKYLEHVKHPKTDELNAAKIKKVKIAWATTSNALDCAVFVMRHMEKYKGAKAEFNTRLSSNGPKKNKQLKILRKRYAAHILLSECNQLRQQIQIEALGK
ncbi:hypothetical protein L1987_54880 [Smallanthus sonchifolius]|uniref:Uncharacterized protein n=1 Tax=Smallanthus sonchifolius TaxID=185202 RepID=A0ACB9E8C6_9ASTR|nr:hypothetical protein L1987_54880 [Smallanthus sonchifolius]